MAMKGGLFATLGASESEIRAVVIRANGDVEDLGRIAYWNKNPLKVWWWNVKKAFGKGHRDEL